MATKTTSTRKSKAAADEVEVEVEATIDEETPAEAPVEAAPAAKSNGKPQEDGKLDLAGLKDMSISELTHIAKEMGIEGASRFAQAGAYF